jgi:cytolysin (calcineurin-like family phosphatase)
LGKIEPSAPAPPKRTIDKKGEAAPLFWPVQEVAQNPLESALDAL